MTRARPTRGSTWYLIGIYACIAIAVAAILIGVSGCDWQTRSEKCTAQGGTVTSEVETKKTRGKDGKTTTRPYTEYECIVNGQEVDEWEI